MPVSDPSNITPIVREILRLNPKSVLDLGVGFGKYGVLCREYLDVERGRLHSADWQTKIIGIEGFGKYNNPNWEQYTGVLIQDFTEHYGQPYYRGYDLVLLIDSLEHVDKPIGHKILDTLLRRNKHVIVSCPTGAHYLEQGAVNGNELERHKAHWTEEDFQLRGGKTIHKGVCVVSSIRGTGVKWNNQ